MQVSCLHHSFSSPLIGSAGTVGFGVDYLHLQPKKLEQNIGGLVFKTITPEPLEGNQSPRVCETEHGFINSIGLQNPGLAVFERDIHPHLAGMKPVRIASVAAFTVADFAMMVSRISELHHIDIIEMNVSCPNTDYHGKQFASDEKLFIEVVGACANVAHRLPLIVKLAPLNNNVAIIAEHAERLGVDGLTISNTFNGLRIDPVTHTPMIAGGGGIGGYSGPAIKPIVLALVQQVSKKVKIPIIGLGGVNSGADVVEYLLAGASLVGVGTANFSDARAMNRIHKELTHYLSEHRLTVTDLIGKMKPHPNA